MTSMTYYFKNAMRVYAAELICSTGVSGLHTFNRLFCIYKNTIVVVILEVNYQ